MRKGKETTTMPNSVFLGCRKDQLPGILDATSSTVKRLGIDPADAVTTLIPEEQVERYNLAHREGRAVLMIGYGPEEVKRVFDKIVAADSLYVPFVLPNSRAFLSCDQETQMPYLRIIGRSYEGIASERALLQGARIWQDTESLVTIFGGGSQVASLTPCGIVCDTDMSRAIDLAAGIKEALGNCLEVKATQLHAFLTAKEMSAE